MPIVACEILSSQTKLLRDKKFDVHCHIHNNDRDGQNHPS